MAIDIFMAFKIYTTKLHFKWAVPIPKEMLEYLIPYGPLY